MVDKPIATFLPGLIALIALLPAALVSAAAVKDDLKIEDYGTKGLLFDIAEPSLLQTVTDKLKAAEQAGKLEQLQQEFADKVKKKVLRPNPVSGIARALEDRELTHDPTYKQETDIRDTKGRIIIAAGTVINPLTELKWGEPLIFIDGDDSLQVELAAKTAGKITLVKGAPLDLSKKLNRRIYFDQGGILTERFGIKAVPAIVRQDGMLLKIREVKI